MSGVGPGGENRLLVLALEAHSSAIELRRAWCCAQESNLAVLA
jgi:hypothetical protein